MKQLEDPGENEHLKAEFNALLNGINVQCTCEDHVVDLVQRLRKNQFDMEKIDFNLKTFKIWVV